MSTVAGTGAFGYSGNGGPAKIAEIGVVFGIAVDGAGNIYLADLENFAVRKIDASGMIRYDRRHGTFLLGGLSYPGAQYRHVPKWSCGRFQRPPLY